jgi:hypothetical protein
VEQRKVVLLWFELDDHFSINQGDQTKLLLRCLYGFWCSFRRSPHFLCDQTKLVHGLIVSLSMLNQYSMVYNLCFNPQNVPRSESNSLKNGANKRKTDSGIRAHIPMSIQQIREGSFGRACKARRRFMSRMIAVK